MGGHSGAGCPRRVPLSSGVSICAVHAKRGSPPGGVGGRGWSAAAPSSTASTMLLMNCPAVEVTPPPVRGPGRRGPEEDLAGRPSAPGGAAAGKNPAARAGEVEESGVGWRPAPGFG